jgi:predicted TIM-barrel fold metal-dependent hydrolase
MARSTGKTIAFSALAGWSPESSGPRRPGKLLPDPEPRPRIRRFISADDHIVEPPDLFEGRLPARFAERAPRIVEDQFGNQQWLLEGRRMGNIGLSAVVGRDERDKWTTDPLRFEDMRRGCWDIHARVTDMDLAGIDASVCFPSFLPGFAGRMFSRLKDHELGLALVRAWNDWHLEVWAGSYPDRIIPCQLTWLNDAVLAAEEIRRNAARGFKAVTFTENPSAHRLPSLQSGSWDPFLAACEETDTVICLHIGGSGWNPITAPDASIAEAATSVMLNAIAATIDWVWSGVATRFPNLRVAFSESGISWVPAVIERIDYVSDRTLKGDPGGWQDPELRPSEVLRRNFWFCGIDDPVGVLMRDCIGVDNILLECDYPHADSSWPDTQHVLNEMLAGVPEGEADMMAYTNAARLFRHDAHVAA